ncbi:MAG: hypothetical protein NUV65_02090 [Candidatus Roizmanbacteria bacterium]|nr:hypothetical protein [Candidatus Roizmanbacteria bacterium]
MRSTKALVPIKAEYNKLQRIISKILKKLLNTNPQTALDYILNLMKIILLLSVTVFVLSFSANIISGFIKYALVIQRAEQKRNTRLSLNPNIDKVEPYLVYSGNKVIIYGKRFGWKGGENVLLTKGNETIITELWTDTKIIFTVPLGWKPGNIPLVIRKQIHWERKNTYAESKKVSIKLLKSTGKINTDDDAYFEQLKTLSPETLKMNGYE